MYLLDNLKVALYYSQSMSKYHQYLKDKYNMLSLCSPEELLECKSSQYINLLLAKYDKKLKGERKEFISGQLNSIVTKCTPLSSPDDRQLSLADMLNFTEEETKVILIEGGPGMGKSTLAIKICKCWANGKLLENYSAVILLPLRDPEIQAANNIGDLLLLENKNEQVLLHNEITASQGDKVCFILEGYDELPEQLRKAPIFSKLREKLPKCTLIYTSRPEACNQLRHIAPQRIEIHGFKEEQIDEYINLAFENAENGKDKALKLIAQMKNNPLIKSILYVPINIAIICHLFLLTLTLPNTLTELYTLLCLNLILRYINKHSPGEVDYLSSLHNLPSQTSEQFLQLCFIAYRGRKDDKIIFSSRELESYKIDVSKLTGLGLLLIAPSTSVYGREKSYNFLHLTVQEFCASFYISKLPDKEQFESFKKYQFYDSFQMVHKFYSGITKLRNKNILHHMLPIKWVEFYYKKNRTIDLLHCVYEAHNEEVCRAVCNHFDGSIDLSYYKLDQISCNALGYLLKQYKGILKLLNVCMCDIGDEGCSTILDSLFSQNFNTYSSDFDKDLDDTPGIDDFSLHIPLTTSSNISVTKLNFGWNKFYIDTIFKSLHYNTVLTELLLRYASIKSADMLSLVQMLASNDTLSVFDISANNIGSDGCQYLADCKSISLNKLIMRCCELGVNGADKIGKMLCENKSIIYIDLAYNRIGDEGVEKLVGHLKCNKTIKHLCLWDNNITIKGANHLKRLFNHNPTAINSIELSDNPLKDEGINLILQSIATSMEYVGLYDTGMTSSCSISVALHKIKSISFTLPDPCNDIGDHLAVTTVLEELILYDGTDAANQIMIESIKRNNSIKKLEFHRGLNYCTILSLTETLKVNNSITELSIHDVDVSPSDYLLLANILIVNTSVKEMRISPSVRKSFEQPLVFQFLKQLEHNCTLKLLSMCITAEATHDKYFIRDVELLVQSMNNKRKSCGVTVPLCVKLY